MEDTGGQGEGPLSQKSDKKFFAKRDLKSAKMEPETWRSVIKNIAPAKKVVMCTAILDEHGGEITDKEGIWRAVQNWGQKNGKCWVIGLTRISTFSGRG